MEFDKKDESSFVAKRFDRTQEYALTFLRQNMTHLFRLGSHNQCRFLGMKKYWQVFQISLQQELYYRASFIMDRARSITIVIAFYAFWTALFSDRATLLGFSKSQMLTYVLGMNILRALIFSDKTWEMLREINMGRLSYYLIRPISYIRYCLCRDMADKCMHLVSSVLEVSFALLILNIPFYVPRDFLTVLTFLTASAFAMLLYFLMTYAVGALAFWTAESMGPRFCFELFLEFAAGAFFPLDVLPRSLKTAFELLPFSSLLYFPLNIFLERLDPEALLRGFAIQIFWIGIFFYFTRAIWNKGLQAYCAEGG